MRAILALAILSIAPGARAEPDRASALALDWQAPPGCPAADRILAETDRILAGSTVRTDPPIQASARVRQEGERWHLALETRRGESTGARSLEGESCTALAEAMIVILVLMVDPALAAETPRLEPVEPPVTIQKPPPPSRPPPVPVIPDPPGCGIEPAVGLAGLGEIGALPGPALGGELMFALHRCRLGAQLSARGLFPRTGEADLDAGAGGDLWLLAAGAAIDLRTRSGLGAHAGFEAGVMSGRGVGIQNPDSGRALWLAATVGASALLRLTPRLAARLALDLVVPLQRPRFVIDDLGSVHRPSPVSARLALGLELAL